MSPAQSARDYARTLRAMSVEGKESNKHLLRPKSDCKLSTTINQLLLFTRRLIPIGVATPDRVSHSDLVELLRRMPVTLYQPSSFVRYCDRH